MSACNAQAVSEIQRELETPRDDRTAVTFSLDAPDAERVTLEGTFNYWSLHGDIVLYKESGKHSVTLYLGDEQWLYRFKVDGEWVHDPTNPLKAEAEGGNYNSILRIGRLIPESIFNPEVSHGTVLRDRLNTIPHVVYLPPNYSEAETYPVLFMLHGYGQPASEWIDASQMNIFMDNLIAKGSIEPFVLVMPTGGTSMWRDGSARHVIEALYPHILKTYRVSGEKAYTAIAGGSMGGYGALELAYDNQDIFGLSVPIMMTGFCATGVCDYSYFADSYPGNFNFDILLYCGAQDDLGFAENYRVFSNYLEYRNKAFELYLTETEGHKQDGHSVRYYRFIMVDVLQKVSDYFNK